MKNFTIKNGNKINPKLLKEHIGDVRYNLQKNPNNLTESEINEKVEYILSSPSLRNKYFSEYKTQMLLEGKPVTQEGFMDVLRNPIAAYQGYQQHKELSKAEQQIKNVAMKVVGNAENQYEQFQKKVKELEAKGLKFPKLGAEAEKVRKLIDGIKNKIKNVFPKAEFGRTAAQTDTDDEAELTAGLEEGFMDSLRAGGDAAALGGLKKILSNITQSILTNYRSIKPQIEKIQASRQDPEVVRGDPNDSAAAELTADEPAAPADTAPAAAKPAAAKPAAAPADTAPAAAKPAAAQPPPVPPEDTAQDDVKNPEDAGAVVDSEPQSSVTSAGGSNTAVTSATTPPATGAAGSTGLPSEPVSTSTAAPATDSGSGSSDNPGADESEEQQDSSDVMLQKMDQLSREKELAQSQEDMDKAEEINLEMGRMSTSAQVELDKLEKQIDMARSQEDMEKADKLQQKYDSLKTHLEKLDENRKPITYNKLYESWQKFIKG